jgi:uncharacterized protein with HEPN domain
MPSKKAQGPLKDIRDNIRLAQSFVEGFTLRKFGSDKRTIYAVIRCLEIISEASRRLPVSLKRRHPHTPWQDVAGAGNVYRHDYEDISTAMIWNTVKVLPDLLDVVDEEMQRLASNGDD